MVRFFYMELKDFVWGFDEKDLFLSMQIDVSLNGMQELGNKLFAKV